MSSIHLPRYERIWLIAGISTLVLFLVLFGILAFGMGLHPPNHMETIDPQAVASTPPFDHPGLKQIGEKEYELAIISQIFMYTPNEVTLPAGSKVTFTLTTPDVIHGLFIPGTNVNLMAIPGHITKYTYTFREPGEYVILCHEYCGIGHHIMTGRIYVQ